MSVETIAGVVVPCGACGRPLRPAAGAGRCVCGVSSRVFLFHPVRSPGGGHGTAPVAAGTPCAYHAGNAASASCERCGSFLCSLCATPVGGRTYCTACFERLHSSGGLEALKNRFPRPHALALAASLGALMPFVGLLFVPLVLWQGALAVRKRREIAVRESGLDAYLVVAALLTMGGLGLTAIVFFER